jgi:hypothetical protein
MKRLLYAIPNGDEVVIELTDEKFERLAWIKARKHARLRGEIDELVILDSYEPGEGRPA